MFGNVDNCRGFAGSGILNFPLEVDGNLVVEEVLKALSFPNEKSLAFPNEYLCWTKSGIVIGGHGKAIGSSILDD